MKLFKVAAFLAAMGIAMPAGAAVYKCIAQDGSTSFSDKPCTVYSQQEKPSRPESPAATAPDAAPQVPPVTAIQPQPQAEAPATPPQPQVSPEPQAPSEQEQARLEEEQQQALEAEFKRRAKSKAGFLFLGAALILVGWIMHVVAAAKLGKTLWAICLFAFSPFSNLPFTVLYWKKAKAGFFVLLAGAALMFGTIVSIYAGLVPS